MIDAIGPATPATAKDVMIALRQANDILKDRNQRIAELEAFAAYVRDHSGERTIRDKAADVLTKPTDN